MKIIQEISSHRQDGWQGQYNRMIRWVEKFKILASEEEQAEDKTHNYFDTMYACFQNIFFLKDWLQQETTLTPTELNAFINTNKEMGICRDICNGTKHYDISNPSVDKQFGIIRQYNQFHKTRKIPKYEIIICAGGDIYKPNELINKCVSVWDTFISDKLNLKKKTNRRKTNN